MFSPRVRFWIRTAVLMCTTTVGFQAFGATDDNALHCFEEGVALFNGAQYGAAAEKFREAYRLKPSWKLLYNIGQSEAADKQYGPALEAFEQFLSEGGDDVAPARRDEVLGEVERLRKMVGFLRVTAPPGTVVYIDGEARGTAPLNALVPVSSGVVHAVSGELDGVMFYSEDVRIIGGKTVAVEMAQPQAAGPEPGAVSEPPEADAVPGDEPTAVEVTSVEKRFPFGPVGWSLAGVGAAAAIAGGALGGLALAKNNELVETCGTDPCPEKADEVKKQDAMGVASTALLAAGGTVLVSGAAVLLAGMLTKKKENRISAGVFSTHEAAGATVTVRF